jgi:hypothetical protein
LLKGMDDSFIVISVVRISGDGGVEVFNHL